MISPVSFLRLFRLAEIIQTLSRIRCHLKEKSQVRNTRWGTPTEDLGTESLPEGSHFLATKVGLYETLPGDGCQSIDGGS